MFDMDKLNKLIEENDISYYKLAKETGIRQAIFSDWKMKRSSPSFKNLQKVAEYFKVDIDYLLNNKDDKVTKPERREHTVQMPLYARICCSNGGFVDDEIKDYIALPDYILNPHKEYFAQNAKGDSMKDANINEDDLLIFEKTNVLYNGDIGCFCVDNSEAVCKKFYKSQDGYITLQPANDKYAPITITVDDTCFCVLGKLVGVYNKR